VSAQAGTIPMAALPAPRGLPLHERRAVVFAAQSLFIFSIFAIWEAISGPVISPFFIGSPIEIAGVLKKWLANGFAWKHVSYTLASSVLGFLLGSAAAIAVGLALGLSRHLYAVFDPFLSAFYAIPKIALAPLLVIWFGLDLTPKVVLAASIVFFLVFNATIAGFRNVDAELLDQVAVMGGTRRHAMLKVILPSVALRILDGLRIAFPYALHGAIVGEIIASRSGVGYLLEFSRGRYDMNMMYASLILLMVVAVAIVAVLDALERYIPKPE
jgi:NitT/TauT family transport system permease protein